MRTPEFFDGIARYSLVTLCALLPFFFVPIHGITIPQSKVALTVVLCTVALLSWMIARFLSGLVRLPLNVILGTCFLIPLAYLASASLYGFASLSLIGTGVEQDTVTAAFTA